MGIAADGMGRAYVTGLTSSTDYPTTPGAFDRTYNGFGDAFVTKLPTVESRAPGIGARGATREVGSIGSALLYALIHRSAWKKINSTKLAVTKSSA
jgi:hypothetical protein